jgi:hypothetical protein
MIEIILGFLIAVTVGLTGMGGGSFTTPALVLLIGVPASEAVGTAMIFAAILRLLAAPFYVVKRHINLKYLGLMLIGAVPGLLMGTWLLHFMDMESWKSTVLLLVGVLLTISSAITFAPRLHNRQFAERRPRWLSFLSLPIGIQTGFSSSGAGALGTVLLLNYSGMTAAQVVGTDLLFGIVLAFIGGAFHIFWGTLNSPALSHLLIGGVPGVLVGCSLANKVPAKRLRLVVAVVAVALGLQLVWTGAKLMLRERVQRSTEAVMRHENPSVSGSAFTPRTQR